MIPREHHYKYLVWYDIADSKGNRAAAAGKDVASYRRQVHMCKQLVNHGLQLLHRQASKRDAEIFCWNGDITSFNDEKHILAAGEDALQWATEVLYILLEASRFFPDVRFRAALVPANFVGTTVTRAPRDTEVRGSEFWEHWSCIKKQIPSREEYYIERHSFLMAATERLTSQLQLPAGVGLGFGLVDSREEILTSEVEARTHRTSVMYGGLVPSVPPP